MLKLMFLNEKSTVFTIYSQKIGPFWSILIQCLSKTIGKSVRD